MLRIAYRPIVLLVCTVMLVGLIAARPLSSEDAMARVEAIRANRKFAPAAAPRAARAPAARRVPRPTAAQIRRAAADTGRGQRGLPAPKPKPKPAPKPVPARIPGDGPWMRGERIAQTERLDLYVGKNTFSADQIAGLAPKFERVLRAAEDYFGTTLKRRVSIAFYRNPPKKGVRGMAFTDEGRIELYYRPGEDTGRAVTIAMHEMGHHLEVQRYGEVAQRRADTILHEGLATWIASIRWLDQCGASSWKGRARQLQAAGIPLRLLTAERSGADNAYEMWASFVDYLTRQYGWEKFDALYASGRGRAPGSANYQKVLGKSLDELADEWRVWVKG
jgi:hypothetical protein